MLSGYVEAIIAYHQKDKGELIIHEQMKVHDARPVLERFTLETHGFCFYRDKFEPFDGDVISERMLEQFKKSSVKIMKKM